MTGLAAELIGRITAAGPISLAEYMAECLMHPKYGYYATRDPFGLHGDFITAPEISQMFGELLGLCLAQAWIDQGQPAPFVLAELGPGRGTLMADVMRATARLPGFHAAARLHLVETSAALRARQQATLKAHAVTWLERVEDLPEAPLFLLANEFFDALPIRQFTRHPQGWCETLVGVKEGRLSPGRSEPMHLAELGLRLQDTRPGDVVEICPAAPAIMDAIGSRLQRFGGMALLIDYGGWHSLGDTFQALKGHQFTDPFAAPGEADLTAHVDFEALAKHAPRWAYATQGAVLDALGLQTRAAQLARGLSAEALSRHLTATRRLTAPEEMGDLFKMLAVFAPNSPPPHGFA